MNILQRFSLGDADEQERRHRAKERQNIRNDAKAIEQKAKRGERYYKMIAVLGISTIATGAMLSTSTQSLDAIFNGHASKSDIIGLAVYFFAVLVGNSLMFAAATKIQHAQELGQSRSWIDISAVAAVIVIETGSFFTFLWQFENLTFDKTHAVKILISIGRALLLSLGSVYLELYLAPGVSPKRIQAMANKLMGMQTIVELFEQFNDKSIHLKSKLELYTASLNEHASPQETMRAIGDAAMNLVDRQGNKLIELPPANDPYAIASAKIVNASTQTSMMQTQSAAKPKDSVHFAPKKKGTNNRKPAPIEEKLWDRRRTMVGEILEEDPGISNYAIVQEMKRRGDKKANQHAAKKIREELAELGADFQQKQEPENS